MILYLAGVFTPFALFLLFLFLDWFLIPPRWSSMGPCRWCHQNKTWRRDDHPWWPWWFWRINEYVHQVKYGERGRVKEWQAAHTVKDHWWSKRRVVR